MPNRAKQQREKRRQDARMINVVKFPCWSDGSSMAEFIERLDKDIMEGWALPDNWKGSRLEKAIETQRQVNQVLAILSHR